jgi:hypothetical protein
MMYGNTAFEKYANLFWHFFCSTYNNMNVGGHIESSFSFWVDVIQNELDR